MPISTATPPATKPARGSSRRATKRATYTVNSQARVLFTVSGEAATRLLDVPADLYESAVAGLATPDTFVVEQQLRDMDAHELEAIITDYLTQAALHSRVPMTFSRLGDLLSTLAE